MQQNDFSSIELPTSCLNNLDVALNRLGMLATGTELRRQYLKEIRNKQSTSSSNKLLQNTIKINTNYVSTVSIGLRQIAPHAIRYKPYTIKERLRTRSENNDDVDNQNLVQLQQPQQHRHQPHQQQQQQQQSKFMDDDNLINMRNDELVQLKKAKSLESIVAENTQQTPIDLKTIRINCDDAILTIPTDMEVVSNSIQNLKVDE